MNRYILLLFVILATLPFLFKDGAEHKKTVIHKIDDDQIKEINEKEEKQITENNVQANETNPLATDDSEDYHWQESVKSNILRQSFDQDVEIKLIKEKSFTWKEFGKPIEVERIKVSLRNPAGETSNFRALVDQNTGKILRTWDRPVFDPINPRQNKGIKLNPLYHPED